MFCKKTLRDPVTGLEYKLLTEGAAPSRKMYFSCESFLGDDRHIIFFRSGEKSDQLIKLDTESGAEDVLADSRDGWSIHSFGLAREKDEGYLIKNSRVYALDALTGETRELAELPERASSCGHYTASKSGLLPMTFKLRCGIFCLVVTDPAKGSSETVYYSDTPLGHCQACPGDDNTIFYCHETGGDALQRMWHFDLSRRVSRPFFVERWGEWVTHETWNHDGSYMTFIMAPDQIWIGEKDGRNFRRVSKSKEYHHCAPSRSGKWITSDRSDHGEIVLVDAETGKDTLLVTGHIPKSGIDHQHPSFNRKGDRVLFSAPENGGCQIGIIELSQLEGFRP